MMELLLETIRQFLEKGIRLSEDLLFFAESTYGLLPENLEAVLGDGLFEEEETLRALIFVPDDALRIAVELLLVGQECSVHDKTVLTEKLSALDEIRFYAPERNISFSLPLGKCDLGRIIDKLYLDRAIDKTLCRTLAEHLDKQMNLTARVMLRCRADLLAPGKVRFFRTFIERAASFHDEFPELFETTLILLGEIPDDAGPTDVAEFFLKKKQVLMTTLKEIREFEQKRDHYSMEYLMMQRYRIPPESEEAVLLHLQRLTTITDAILKLDQPSNRVRYHDRGGFDPGVDLEKLFRLLS